MFFREYDSFNLGKSFNGTFLLGKMGPRKKILGHKRPCYGKTYQSHVFQSEKGCLEDNERKDKN
jgi:hypothetical protein